MSLAGIISLVHQNLPSNFPSVPLRVIPHNPGVKDASGGRGVALRWARQIWRCRSHQIRYWSRMCFCRCPFFPSIPSIYRNSLSVSWLQLFFFWAISSSGSARVQLDSGLISINVCGLLIWQISVDQSSVVWMDSDDERWAPVVQHSNKGDILWIDRPGHCQARKYRRTLPLTLQLPALFWDYLHLLTLKKSI